MKTQVCDRKLAQDFNDWKYGCFQHCQDVSNCEIFARGVELDVARRNEFAIPVPTVDVSIPDPD